METIRIAYKGKIFETKKGNWEILKRMSDKGIKIGIEYLKNKRVWKEIK